MNAKNVNTETAESAISVGKKQSKTGKKERAKKTLTRNTPLYKKATVIEKLISLGVQSEEEIKKLTPPMLLSSKDLSFDDINIIRDLQANVNDNTLFSFLTQGMSEVINNGEQV